MQPTDLTPSAPVPAESQVETTQQPTFPMAVDWNQAVFGPAETPTTPDTTTPPAETPASVEAQPEAQPPDATEPPAEAPPAQEAPEEVIATEEDQALYDSIAAELRSQYPNAEPALLKRLIDDKFTVKQLLAVDEKKSKQITQLLKRVTKKESPQRIVTDFERSLVPTATPPAPPPPPVQPPVAQPAVIQQPPEIPDHLRWTSAEDVFNSEAAIWGEFHDESATPSQKAAAAKKLSEIKDVQIRLTLNTILPGIIKQAQDEARADLQAELGDVIPVMRQTAVQKQQEASHAFAVAELEKAGVEGIRELVTPVSATPLIYDGDQYDDTPLNRVMAAYPLVNKINVTHDAAGKPYPPQTAERLTRIERYKAAAELWPHLAMQARPEAKQPNGTPQPDRAAVGQAFQAGLTAAKQTEVDRARQGLNAGAGATSLPGAPVERSLADEFAASGAVDFRTAIFGKP